MALRRLWVVVLGLLVACSSPPGDSHGRASLQAPDSSRVREALDPLHRPLARPRAGDWLSVCPENGQTFGQYLAYRPVRAEGLRRVIYLELLGNLDETEQRALEAVREFVGIHFGLPVKMAPRIDDATVPPGARRQGNLGKEQLLTTWILAEELRPRLPADAAVLMAFTSSDMWPGEGWNYLFGQATFERVGVCSFSRLKLPSRTPVPFATFLRRSLKLASHEMGHLFGLLHCVNFSCGMNGASHIEELDRHPLEVCPLCLSKLVYATRVDRVERFRRLEAFALAHGLEGERNLYHRSLFALESLPP